MTETRDTLRFIDGEALREFSGFDPTLTILDWLRLDERRIGTKEGCAEGDCGACTVVVGRLAEAQVQYRAINACIAPARVTRWSKADHGRAPQGGRRTASGAAGDGRSAWVAMRILHARHRHVASSHSGSPEGRERRAHRGRARRQPLPLHRLPADRRGRPRHVREGRSGEGSLASPFCRDGRAPSRLQDDRRLEIVKANRRFIAPSSLDDFANVYARHRDATILAGATDVGTFKPSCT